MKPRISNAMGENEIKKINWSIGYDNSWTNILLGSKRANPFDTTQAGYWGWNAAIKEHKNDHARQL